MVSNQSLFIEVNQSNQSNQNKQSKLQMQEFEIIFLQRIKKISVFEKVRNTAILRSLNIESLLLRIKKFQLTWFLTL